MVLSLSLYIYICIYIFTYTSLSLSIYIYIHIHTIILLISITLITTYTFKPHREAQREKSFLELRKHLTSACKQGSVVRYPSMAFERWWYSVLGKGQMGSALMGSLQISSFLTEGLFGYSR